MTGPVQRPASNSDARKRAEEKAHTAENDAVILEPWGPFEMGGFEGCADQDPDRCACATHRQPTCEVCGQEIEPGERAWARQWPCYNTLPLNSLDQDWDIISWHDECPDTRVTPPGSTVKHPGACHDPHFHVGCVIPPGSSAS